MTGFFVTAFTARVTSAAASGLVPKAMPPWRTLGQEMFTSRKATCSSASMRAQQATYSSREKPLMLAMMGLWKILRRAGSSSAITWSMPGFCNPTLLSMPSGHSAMRGRGLPKRASWVVPLKLREPRILMS